MYAVGPASPLQSCTDYPEYHGDHRGLFIGDLANPSQTFLPAHKCAVAAQ